jgi:hypothetical protein
MIFYRGVSKEDGERILKLQKFTVSTTEHYRKNTDMGYVYLTTDIGAAYRYGALSKEDKLFHYPLYIFRVDFPEECMQIDYYEKNHLTLCGNYFFRFEGDINFGDCAKVEYAIIDDNNKPNILLNAVFNGYDLDDPRSTDWEYGEIFENEIHWIKV